MSELHRASNPQAVIDSVRSLMRADPFVGFVTVDANGQPRVRTVEAYPDSVDAADPARGVTVWILTRGGTRKVAQLQENPRVTLYFTHDQSGRYATLMGRATIITDTADARVRGRFTPAQRAFFWPQFPADFAMIQVRPMWIEYAGPGIDATTDTWRPQAVVFDSTTR